MHTRVRCARTALSGRKSRASGFWNHEDDIGVLWGTMLCPNCCSNSRSSDEVTSVKENSSGDASGLCYSVKSSDEVSTVGLCGPAASQLTTFDTGATGLTWRRVGSSGALKLRGHTWILDNFYLLASAKAFLQVVSVQLSFLVIILGTIGVMASS